MVLNALQTMKNDSSSKRKRSRDDNNVSDMENFNVEGKKFTKEMDKLSLSDIDDKVCFIGTSS